MSLSRRRFLIASAALLCACTGRRDKVLNFYNWSNFIAPDTLSNFERESGIQVNYEEFSSADVMFAKLKIGVTGYDLVVAPGYMVRRMIRHDLLRPIGNELPPLELLPHLATPPYDPELRYSVPYLWGTTGVGYNSEKISGKPTSWDLLWDQDYGRHFTILDEKRDAIGMALFRLGFSPNSVVPEELQLAKEELLRQRPLVRRYTSDFTDDLIRGETWAALGWSGDVAQAKAANPKVEFFLPDEGGFLFVDSLVIPKGAPHPEAALAFIKYFLRPEVCSKITNATGYANGVKAAKVLVRPDLIDNSLGYPTQEVMQRLAYQEDLGAAEAVWDRIWEEVKR
jgi:spermidine/putrescine transport system substrate-binding protein